MDTTSGKWAHTAILDPELTLTLPMHVTAQAGIDALVHAVETLVSRAATPYSTIYAREALRLLIEGLPTVLRSPDSLQARSQMQLGAAYAGIAIENSMLGAAHAMANPLTAKFGTPHGTAVGLMLPVVLKFNAILPHIARAYGDCGLGSDAVEIIIGVIRAGMASAGLPSSLSQLGVNYDDIAGLASMACEQWTGKFNPIELGKNEYTLLYESIWA